jgi:hypothetical protein
MENKLSLDEYKKLMRSGESRKRPGVDVTYIMPRGHYAEWKLVDIETDDDGEVTPAGWQEVDRQDAEHLPQAYEAYLKGEDYVV